MPKSAPAAISPDPFVKWKFKALTSAEKKDKIAKARAYLAIFLKGHEQALTFVPGLKKRNYIIVDHVIPGANGSFTYAPTVKRKPVIAGQPESGKDPQRPSPPPAL